MNQHVKKGQPGRQTAAILSLLAILATVLVACQPATPNDLPAAALAPTSPPATATAPPPATAAPTTLPTTLPTATPPQLPTAIPSVTPTATPIPSPTPDRTIACSQRIPGDNLLTVVTLTYGLSRDYVPADIVALSDYLPSAVTQDYPTELRAVAVQPLVEMIADMQTAGLEPFIISGYRSYSAQAIARQKWVEKEPERVNILSAPPGFSEHQLGTVVDFGSPELPDIVGDPDIEFHTWFYKTREGIWLLENAHRYGFTLSYTREAMPVTGFYYEPWHYRYVGIELATWLHEMGLSLTEYQLAAEPPPCVPDSE